VVHLNLQVRNLRERLEEEHQALLQREGDKAVLEVRIARLTRIILHSTRIAKPGQAYGQRYRHLLLRESQACSSLAVMAYFRAKWSSDFECLQRCLEGRFLGWMDGKPKRLAQEPCT